MAIKLIVNYAKRLGLPGYSSHQCSVSVETELTDLGQVPGEISRHYGELQDAVDGELQQTGFVPGEDYGLDPGDNGSAGHRREAADSRQHRADRNGSWACSDKQKELILKLVDEHNLDRKAVEQTAQARFGAGVRELNKLQASGLIDELLETCGRGKNGGNRPAKEAAADHDCYHSTCAGAGVGHRTIQRPARLPLALAAEVLAGMPP